MRLIAVLFLTFVLSSSSLADELLIFSATWCRPCQQLHEAIEADPSLLEGYTATYVDFTAERDKARAHGVTVVPTLIATDSQGRKRQKTGFNGAQDLRRWLRGGR